MGYTVMGSFATVQVISPTQVVDVLRITFRTDPSGVVAFANVPYKNLVGFQVADADQAASVFIAPLADGIERAIGTGRVAGATGTEDIDASGLLIDYIDLTVQYDPGDPARPGPFQSIIRIPVFAFEGGAFFGPLVLDKINAAYDALVALAGG